MIARISHTEGTITLNSEVIEFESDENPYEVLDDNGFNVMKYVIQNDSFSIVQIAPMHHAAL